MRHLIWYILACALCFGLAWLIGGEAHEYAAFVALSVAIRIAVDE